MSKITPQEADEIKARATELAIEAVSAAQVKALAKPIADAVAKAVSEIASRPEPEPPAPVMLTGNYPMPDNATWQAMILEEKRGKMAETLEVMAKSGPAFVVNDLREHVISINDFIRARSRG